VGCQVKKQGVKPPVAKAVEALIETGDFHVTTIGDNLPNENEIHQKYGSKSFMFPELREHSRMPPVPNRSRNSRTRRKTSRAAKSMATKQKT